MNLRPLNGPEVLSVDLPRKSTVTQIRQAERNHSEVTQRDALRVHCKYYSNNTDNSNKIIFAGVHAALDPVSKSGSISYRRSTSYSLSKLRCASNTLRVWIIAE